MKKFKKLIIFIEWKQLKLYFGGNGNQFYVTKHVSASGLDRSPLVTSSSFPALTFVPTSASTTANLVQSGRGSVSWGSSTVSNFDTATANAANIKGSATGEYSVSSSKSLQTGDIFTITNKTVSGFTINFANSSGSAVDRTFDYIAKGFGLQR